jgi:hypothetical protein
VGSKQIMLNSNCCGVPLKGQSHVIFSAFLSLIVFTLTASYSILINITFPFEFFRLQAVCSSPNTKNRLLHFSLRFSSSGA